MVPLFLVEVDCLSLQPDPLPVDWRHISPSLHSGHHRMSFTTEVPRYQLMDHFVQTFTFLSAGQILKSLPLLFSGPVSIFTFKGFTWGKFSIIPPWFSDNASSYVIGLWAVCNLLCCQEQETKTFLPFSAAHSLTFRDPDWTTSYLCCVKLSYQYLNKQSLKGHRMPCYYDYCWI